MSDASSPQIQKEPRSWTWRAGFAAAVVAVLAGLCLLLRPAADVPPPAPGEPVAASGAPIQETAKIGEALRAFGMDPEAGNGEGIPTEILAEMQRCLRAPELSAQGLAEDEVEPGVTPAPSPRVLRTEEALAEIEKELGPAMMQGDLWTDWIVRLPGGLDRKVHLENIEDESGRIQQNLSLFQIDQSGKAMRVPLSDTEERNPDMAMISNLLNEGEILRKETSRYYQFAGGERLEIIELDGRPTEFEIVRGEIFFRCDKMDTPDNCTCIR